MVTDGYHYIINPVFHHSIIPASKFAIMGCSDDMCPSFVVFPQKVRLTVRNFLKFNLRYSFCQYVIASPEQQIMYLKIIKAPDRRGSVTSICLEAILKGVIPS